jgi:cell filamentation protein, protein adenylyltransferase
MRTYERTHPWLNFSANLKRAPVSLWLMLGECQSKCEHIARVPLQPDTARELYRIYLAKGALATTAIEGNTLSEEEVLQHLDGKLKLPPSREYLAREIDNVIKGCNEALASVQDQLPAMDARNICDLNRTLLNGLELEEGVIPGRVRKHSVVVGRYRGAPAEDCEHLLGKLCEWLEGDDFRPTKDQKIVYAVLKAVIAHLYIAWIHPFGDGNGRTARLLEFRILLSAGVPAASAHLLSNHYNLTRSEYYRQLKRTSKSGGEIAPFVEYAVRGFLDGLKEQLDRIWEQQWDLTWRNYVHEWFKSKSSRTQARQRHLVLELSRHPEPCPASAIPRISVRLAEEYTTKTAKTLARDLSAMCKGGLLEKTPRGYRARKELILAFLPKQTNQRLSPAGSPVSQNR